MEAVNLDDERSFSFGRQWGQIVEEYTTLGITYKQDVLPALSGLCKQMKHLKLGRYVGGIWTRDFAYQLGWHRDLPCSECSEVSHVLSPNKTLPQRPTFSWITSAGPVKFHLDEGGVYQTLATILAACCSPATSDIHGRVTDCSLSVQGPVVSGEDLLEGLDVTRMDVVDIDWAESMVHLDCTLRDCWEPSHRHYSGLEALRDWVGLVCLGLFTWSKMNSEHHPVDALDALLLLPDGSDPRSHIRVGIVTNLSLAWFAEHASDKVLTLV